MGLAVMMAAMRKVLLIPGLILVGLIVYMALTEVHIITDAEKYLRLFAYKEAFSLFRNHPVLGVGPGMFGGLASILFNSPYYNYWPTHFKDFVFNMGSVDSFWPVILAETGILGFIAYLMIFITLCTWLSNAARWYRTFDDTYMAALGKVARNYTLAVIIMCFFTGLNNPFVTYTFFSLCGIYLSVFSIERRKFLIAEKKKYKISSMCHF